VCSHIKFTRVEVVYGVISSSVACCYHNITFDVYYLRQRLRRYMFLPVFVCLCVCLSVCVQDYSKTGAWIWMKCCVSTDVGTWTNRLTF